jgi:DNA-binding NarL/FixJ family response regulator
VLFVARLPLITFALPDNRTYAQSGKQRNGCTASNSGGGGVSLIGATMIRILLADNHLVIRAGLRALFQARSNFQICGETGDGRGAVDLATQRKPDVVVININLPVISGIEATRQICQRAPDTNVLIYTAENNADLMREALRAGARGYLLKFSPDEQIIEAIETLARRRPFYSGSASEKILDDATVVRGVGNGVHLTAREREILRLIAEGNRSKHIALVLGISQKTVDTHRTTAMRKLHLQSVAQVVRYAVRERLIQV